MASSLAPGFVKMLYTGNGHEHIATYPVKPSASGDTWALEKVLGGTYDPWTAALDAYVIIFKTALKTTDSIVSAELWTQADENADPVFREAYAIGVAGTNPASPSPWNQVTMPVRTAAGGLLRLFVMEGAQGAVNTVDRPPLAAGAFKSIVDFSIASTGFVFGRDGSRPIACTGIISKTNDALRKKFLIEA